MLQKQKISDNDHYDHPLIYSVNGHTLYFGRHEFCLISGFKFGFLSFHKFMEGDITFHDRVFPEKIGEYLKNIDLLSLIEDEYRFSSLSDPDSIRVCLLLYSEVIFMGHELGSVVDDVFLRMVEDLDVWNDFPWGEHMWRELYGAIRNVNLNHQQGHHKALEMNPNFVPTYSLSGFLLSFKIWILESSCVTNRWRVNVLKKSLEDVPGPSISHSKIRRIMGNFFPREKDGDAKSGCQTSTKEVSLKDRVKAMEGLCTSLMILPKEIKSLKARVYKLETIINMVNFGDLGDKYWSDKDGNFFSFNVSPNQSANKDPVNELVDALNDLVDESLKTQMIDFRTAGPAKDLQSPKPTEEAVALLRLVMIVSYCNSYFVQPTKYYEYISARNALEMAQEEGPQELRGQGQSPRLPHQSPALSTSPQTQNTTNFGHQCHQQAKIDRGGHCCVWQSRATPEMAIYIPRNRVRRNETHCSGVHLSRLHEMSTLILQGYRRSGQLDPVDLKKKMKLNIVPRNEIKKIEAEIVEPKVQGTDVVAYNQRFQELGIAEVTDFPERDGQN
ncbi:phospholipase-like, aminotransferase-like mobile domain protein [Tanacetum coccineum]